MRVYSTFSIVLSFPITNQSSVDHFQISVIGIGDSIKEFIEVNFEFDRVKNR